MNDITSYWEKKMALDWLYCTTGIKRLAIQVIILYITLFCWLQPIYQCMRISANIRHTHTDTHRNKIQKHHHFLADGQNTFEGSDSKASNPAYLRLIHPRHVHFLGAVWALEGVGRINRDVVEGVVEGYKSWLTPIELANLFKRLLLKPSKQRPHIQKLLTLGWKAFLHLASYHHDNQKTDESLICSVDRHDETSISPQCI